MVPRGTCATSMLNYMHLLLEKDYTSLICIGYVQGRNAYFKKIKAKLKCNRTVRERRGLLEKCAFDR